MQIVSGCCNTTWLLLSSLINCFEVGDLGLIFMYLTLPSDFVQHWWWCYPYFQTHAVHCGFVESVHHFAVQGGAIMSFVGYLLLDKHFGSSIWEHNSSSTPNTGSLILLLTNPVSMFVSGSGKSHHWYAGCCFVCSAGLTLWWRGKANS